MAIDMLSSVFMSVTNQQREVGEPYRNPWHNAMQWKWAVDQAQRESVKRLLKQLGMQTFFDGWVYPTCLRGTPYANYAFPLQGQYYNQLVPYPLTQGSAKVCWSMTPGMYPSDSPTAAMATAQQGPVTKGGEPAPHWSPTTEMGFTVWQAAAVEQAITTQHAEAAQRAWAVEIELAIRQATAATAQQAVAAQVSTSEMSVQPSIQVPPQLQRTFLTDEIVERTPEEQEQYNYSWTLSYNLDYSPDEDVSVIRSPGTDWDDPSTMTTDTEITDAMIGFNLNSLADNREVLYSQTGMNLGPLPSMLPNLQTQMELDQLRRPDSQSQHTYSNTWSDANLYRLQKDAMVKSVQQRQSCSANTCSEKPHKWDQSDRDVANTAKRRSQSRRWEEDAEPLAQGAEGGGAPLPEQEPDIKVIPSRGDRCCVIATLNWMLGPDSDFPAHLSINQPLAFQVWAMTFPLDKNALEVESLSYLEDYEDIAINVVAWVLRAITHVYAGRTLPFPDAVTYIDRRLHRTDMRFQFPPTMPYPQEITYNADTRFKAREKWEQLCSWVQYWHEASMHREFQLEPITRPHRFTYFASKRRWESRLVLFIMSHLNPVLPEEAPIWLDVIMANTGWDPVQTKFKEQNRDLIQCMNWQEREKVVPEEHEREVICTHQRTHGEADCQYLKSLTHAAIRCHHEAKKLTILVAEKWGGQHWQTSQARCVESRHRDKQRSSHHRTPPTEETLTKMMPQCPVQTAPVRLHRDRTTSKWETTDPELAEEEQGSEAESPPMTAEGPPERVPMLELHSDEEYDPLDENKVRAKDRAHVASLEHLAPLADTPEAEPEWQAGTIADTPELESEPAEAHELTGEGTTDADTTDPTTSDGHTEGDEGDYAINWEELEAMYWGTSMCWDDRRKGILLPTTPELHPVPSPPDAMLDEPEADASTAPDASPVTELWLLQEPGVPE